MEQKIRIFLPYFLILPTLIYEVFISAYPIAYAIGMAFSGNPPALVQLFQDFERFKEVIFYTILTIVTVIPLQLIIAIFASIFFLNHFRGRELVLYFFILPVAISEVAGALFWYTMFSSSGLLNKLLIWLGVIPNPIYFFGYEFRDRTLLVIVLEEVWRATAIVFTIIYAGIQMINREYFEAADVFGFNFWQKLRYITVPLLKPSIQTALIIRTLFAFQIVGPILILGGEYIRVMATEVVYWYSQRMDPYIASAWAVLIGVVTFVLSILYIRMFRAGEGA
jgi:multiple sugar transport system permease protein